MAQRSHWRLIVAVVLMAGVSGCVDAGRSPLAQPGSERERQQAQEALARWAAAVESAGGRQEFVPVGELTGQIGDWEAEVGDNNKPALYAGMVESGRQLSGRRRHRSRSAGRTAGRSRCAQSRPGRPSRTSGRPEITAVASVFPCR